MTPEHKAYEATREFQDYLAAKMRWEFAHDQAQINHHNPSLRNQETITYWAMNARLETARRTPEHKAAFGF